jgi:hypothetical protein
MHQTATSNVRRIPDREIEYIDELGDRQRGLYRGRNGSLIEVERHDGHVDFICGFEVRP